MGTQSQRSLQQAVLDQLHDQHLGIVRMKSLSRLHIWFAGIDKMIEKLGESFRFFWAIFQ